MLNIDEPTTTHIHIIGIGGTGMSAIAVILSKMGMNVSGSDEKESLVTERLIDEGFKISVPHSTEIINPSIDYVVCSSAIKQENIEVIAASEYGIRILSRSEILAWICQKEKSVGIAGSHGKTTTTSMVVSIAISAGLDPSYIIGGDLCEFGTNAQYKHDALLVVEADESDKTFLELNLKGAIVTNIEKDHLENYDNSFTQLTDSFFKFIMNVDGPVVICVDEPNASDMAKRVKGYREVITVGKDNADWKYTLGQTDRMSIEARIEHNKEYTDMRLPFPGEHNVRNALCSIAFMNALGVDVSTCISALSTFKGVGRRYQLRGQVNGITFIDDYAHLPTEVKMTIKASLEGRYNRVIAIFQPHRYTRTQAMYKEFAQSLLDADLVIVTDIYAAGEQPIETISSQYISKELEDLGHKETYYIASRDEIVNFVADKASSGDLILTLGAGDITSYPDLIISELNKVEI